MIISIILTALFLKIKLHMKYNWVELSFLKAVELWFKSFYEKKKFLWTFSFFYSQCLWTKEIGD